MLKHVSFATWILLIHGFVCSALAAEPLAILECQEITGRDWGRTLVTYYLEGPRVNAYHVGDRKSEAVPPEGSPGRVRLQAGVKPDEVKLLDAVGKEVPFQLWRVRLAQDGTIASARLSFHAELPAGGNYRYELLAGKPMPAASSPKAIAAGGVVTLDNGMTAVRLPYGKRQFRQPLAVASDHAQAMKDIDNLEAAGLAFGPIAGIRLADGRWIGGSYFTTEPIEAVRYRQKYRPDAPDADLEQAALAVAPKVTGFQGEVAEQGPLFVEAWGRYAFDNGGHYQLTVRVLADDPAIRIDEVMDLKTNCPPDHPVYVAMLLSNGWRQGGWKPDGMFFMTTRSNSKFVPLEEALKLHAFHSKYASVGIDYAQDHSVVTEVVPHDLWSDRAHYLGLVESGRLKADKAAPFVGIVPQHAGSWRAAHWVFPPKTPHLFHQLLSWKDGSVEMRWNIRSQPHSQDVLHTGEFDPDFGLTGMRRLWCLVGGAFQYHDTLYPLRAYEGCVNLDNYKDWNLAWSDDTRSARSVPLSPDDASAGPMGHLNGAFICDDREYAWFSHYRQAEKLTWAVDLRRRLDQPGLSPAVRGYLRRNVAAFCCLMSEPDFNTRASMTHQGNPNMPINRFFSLPFAAVLIPDHPQARQWLDVSAEYVRYKLGMNTAPLGAWSELISYYGASAPTLVHGALSAQWQGRLAPSIALLAAGPVDFTLKLLSPPDPRFGCRVVPGFGHEGNLIFNQWTPAAALIEKQNPDLAAAFVWAWDQQGRPAGQQHDNGFTELTGNQVTGLLPKATPELLSKQLKSVWLPGFGAVLRSHGADPKTTYLGFRQGFLASHSDANQGDFVLYAKGAPLTVMSLFGYAMRQQDEYKQAYADFGWHSRVRFGQPSDDGGWPGGGPVSGVHRHYFSDPADYLLAVGDYSPKFLRPGDSTARDLSAPAALRWTRQVLFLKDHDPEGPNYFVFRDSFRNLHGDAQKLPPTWWYQRTLGAKDQVKVSATGFDYTSQWGPTLNVHFLQPARVAVESRELHARGPLYNYAARNWIKAGTPRSKQEGDSNCTVDEALTVNRAGPIPAGQDVLVAIYPQGPGEAPPQYEALRDGVAKITTAKSTDFVFANPDGMSFENDEVSLEGVAGAVRVFRDRVQLSVAEGEGTVRYRGYTLKARQPTTKVVPIGEIAKGGMAEFPTANTSIAFALSEKAGKIEEIAPGVRKQTLPNGVAYEFDSREPLTFEQDQVIFSGRRGGILVDRHANVVRLVMLDGQRIGHGKLLADVGCGPYDVTFHTDRIVGKSEGPGRFVHLTMPEGIVQLPALTIGGISYAPGTHGNIAIVPLLDERCDFTLENLKQPPVFRSWQQW